MLAQQTIRQAIRKTVIFTVFLLFPVLLNYFSPYLIIESASRGIVNGSFILFLCLFVFSLFLGRLWCAWVCPGAGLQEASFMIQAKPARGGKLNWIKWGIWFVWLAAIIASALSAGGYHAVNPLYMLETGISVTDPANYIMYYFVIGTIFVLSLTAGRRAFCHYGCWMAPFMITGRKVRNQFGWPSLRLESDKSKCKNCKDCTSHCPMSLDVNGMVQSGVMEKSECILCATCIDGCPQGVISYTFSAGKTGHKIIYPYSEHELH
jgi:ferredoxin-type protein NapH